MIQSLKSKYPHLEISVVKYSEVQADNESIRIDSEYFKQEYLENERIIKSMNYTKLINICYFIRNGDDCRDYEKNGIKYIRTGDIKEYGLDLYNCATIRNDFMSEIKLSIGDLLITRKGNYGKSQVINKKEILQSVISSEIFLIKLKNINPYYVDTFLKSKFGQSQFERNIHGVSNFSVTQEALLNFLIPMFSKEFQLEIETIVKESYKALEDSKALYKEAKNILNKDLSFDNLTLDKLISIEKSKNNHLNISIRQFKDSYIKTGRLDAEYYQNKYDIIENIIKGYRKGYCKLINIGFFTNGSFIPENFYIEQAKRAYIRIKELSLDSPINIKECIYINDNFKNSNETIVKENDFVIATIGNTIGKINLIPKELDGSFISNNTSRFRLMDKNVNPNFLELLLRSDIVQEQIQREFTQTAQPKISNSSLENIIIPKVDCRIQEKIESKIKKSLELRIKSKELLENAKLKIEKAIIES